MRGKQGLCLGKVLYLWLFVLGASTSLSESSCSSAASFRLLVRASALRMFASTLWCSAGSMLFTSSKLETQQTIKITYSTWHCVVVTSEDDGGEHVDPFHLQPWHLFQNNQSAVPLFRLRTSFKFKHFQGTYTKNFETFRLSFSLQLNCYERIPRYPQQSLYIFTFLCPRFDIQLFCLFCFLWRSYKEEEGGISKLK